MNVYAGILILIAVSAAGFLLFWNLLTSFRKQSEEAQALRQREWEDRMSRFRSDWDNALHRNFQTTQQSLAQLSESLMSVVGDTRRAVQTDLKQSTELLGDLRGKLGELAQASRQIHDIGKDIASLEDLLKAPKLRGGLGEYFLQDILSQILPRAFFTSQYAFRSGAVVDAVIRLGERLVCVDSKFPLETFRGILKSATDEEALRCKKEFIRDVKKHIDDIAGKYILPAEGTFDFALMYVPAENVYYEVIIKDSLGPETANTLFEYALQKKVIPVSPNSIFAYLQVICLGLKGLQLEGRTQSILENLSMLRQEFETFTQDFDLIGKHLKNSTKAYENAHQRLERWQTKMSQLELPAPENQAQPDHSRAL